MSVHVIMVIWYLAHLYLHITVNLTHTFVTAVCKSAKNVAEL